MFTEIIILLIILLLQLHQSVLAQFICHLTVHPDSKQNNFNHFIIKFAMHSAIKYENLHNSLFTFYKHNYRSRKVYVNT